LGTLLAAFTSFKLHSPDLLSNASFLTWGRIRPAHLNVMLYGWASNVGMGTAIWLMARLCRTTLRHPLLLVTGGAFWNLGVLLGVCAILAGDSTGYHWLEFPSYAAVTLFVAYSLIISWAVLMFRFRRGDPIYITQWYLLAAFLWFPWMYLAAQTMLFIVPVQGVFVYLRSIARYYQFSEVSVAYSHLGLYAFFSMIIFGAMYYIVPRLVGREWRFASLIKIHFWASVYGIG